MTHPSTDPATEPTKVATRRRTVGVRPLLVLIFRLLLLGVGSAIALLIGIGLAQFSPGRVDDKPFLEDVLRGVARLRGAPYPEVDPALRSPEAPREVSPSAEPVPEGDTPEAAELEAVPEVGEEAPPNAPAEAAPGTGSGRAPNAEVPVRLSPQAQQALQRQLDQLQTEQGNLEAAIARLETQVGIEPSPRPLDERIAELEQRIGRTQQRPTPSTAPSSGPSATPPAPAPQN